MMPLSDIVVPRNEKVQPSQCSELPFIGLDDIEAHTMRLLGTKSSGKMKSAAKRFYPGDVLYSRLRPYLNKVWRADRNGICSSEFIILPGNSYIVPEFLALRLNASDFVKFANSLNAGDRPRVDFDQISSFFLPPFSFKYQYRIVAKIEELFSDLDKGIESLKTARQQLKVYRQALLKHAFEGKLTEQWRKEKADSLISAEKFFQKICEEKLLYLSDKIKNGDNEAKRYLTKTKKNKPMYPGLDLPAQARWVSLLEVCSFVVDCHNKTAQYEQAGIYLIRTPCIRNGKIRLNHEARFITEETYDYWSRRCPPEPGDVIFTREAPIGEAGIVPENTKLCMGQRMMLLRPPKGMDSKYLLYCLLEPLFQSRMGKDSVGTGVKHLRVGDVENFCIPLFPLEEQEEIVVRLESALSVLDEQEADIDQNLQRSEALRQSILKKAFSGQLVAQDPNDEPASELLQRIQAQKAELAAQAKATKAASKKKSTGRKKAAVKKRGKAA